MLPGLPGRSATRDAARGHVSLRGQMWVNGVGSAGSNGGVASRSYKD